jgi:hypothetical protein
LHRVAARESGPEKVEEAVCIGRDQRGIFVSNASDSLDPIDLAKGEISRSKDAVVSAAKDLGEHDRWLKQFIAEEDRKRSRHARYLKREQRRLRRQLKRQQMARSARRAALSVALFMRSVSVALAKGVAYTGHLIWASAVRVVRETYVLAVALLKLLSAGVVWTWAKACAVGLASLKATSSATSWGAAKTRVLIITSLRLLATSYAWLSAKAVDLARIVLRGASIGSSWTAARLRSFSLTSFRLLSIGSSRLAAKARALAIMSTGTASAAFTWTRAKSQNAAQASLKATTTTWSWLAVRANALTLAIRDATLRGSSWTTVKTRVLARTSSKAASHGLSLAQTKGHAFAIASRDAAVVSSTWMATKAQTFANVSSVAAVRGFGLAWDKGHIVALATRDAAVIGSAWTVEKVGTLARASQSAASRGGALMQAGAIMVTHKFHRASATASLWLRSATHSIAERLPMLTDSVRRIVERQGENASLILLRLNAQAKGELHALRHALHAGELMPPAWRKFAGAASPSREMVNGLENHHDHIEAEVIQAARETATLPNRGYVSRNALICVEQWRCKLPVVQAESRRGAPRGARLIDEDGAST